MKREKSGEVWQGGRKERFQPLRKKRGEQGEGEAGTTSVRDWGVARTEKGVERERRRR